MKIDNPNLRHLTPDQFTSLVGSLIWRICANRQGFGGEAATAAEEFDNLVKAYNLTIPERDLVSAIGSFLVSKLLAGEFLMPHDVSLEPTSQAPGTPIETAARERSVLRAGDQVYIASSNESLHKAANLIPAMVLAVDPDSILVDQHNPGGDLESRLLWFDVLSGQTHVQSLIIVLDNDNLPASVRDLLGDQPSKT